MKPKAPFAVNFDLGTLTDKGAELTLAPNEAERAAIAGCLGIEAVDGLRAVVQLARGGTDIYSYEASFEADVVQTCVVSLDLVPAHLTGEFRRIFRVVSSLEHRKAGPKAGGEILAGEDEEPDVLDSYTADLAVPLLDELSLSLEPYPRARGAAFAVPEDASSSEDNPFAVLRVLKGERNPKRPRKSARETAKPRPKAKPKSTPKD